MATPTVPTATTTSDRAGDRREAPACRQALACRGLLALLAVLILAGVLSLVLAPPKALLKLAGTEDPPLRVVLPDRLVRQEAAGTWAQVAPGAQVQPGSLLESRAGRSSVLRVRGGGSVRLDRDSLLRVQRLVRREDASFQVRSMLFRGRAFVHELSSDTLPVDTVFTRIQPVRASYEVSHRPGKDGSVYTQVRVHSGRVRVGLARGTVRDVTLQPGQMIQVAEGRMGSVQALAAPDPWQAWNLSWTDTDAIPPFPTPGGAASPPAREGRKPREGATDEQP